MNMDISKMVFGGAILGTLASCWGSIKSIGWKICTILLKRVELGEDLGGTVLNYLKENHKYYKFHDINYTGSTYMSKKSKLYESTAWEDFSNCCLIFFKDKIPFYLHKYDTRNQDKDGNTVKNKGCTVYYLRGTLNFKDIIKKSVDRLNKICANYHIKSNSNKDRFSISYIPGIYKEPSQDVSYNFTQITNDIITHNLDDLGFYVNKQSVDTIVLTDQNRDIIKLAEMWLDNKEWYKRKDISWKMGWLLHGPPGTGKTALSRKIVEHLNIPIFVFRLGMIGDLEFSEEWAKMQSKTPCVALIEDFDNVFHGRENVVAQNPMEGLSMLMDKDSGSRATHKKLSFDNLLNTLDGAERYEGILTIITTNHIDKIDNALLDRPGRIDRVIELTYLTDNNKIALIEKILGDMPLAKSIALEYIRSNATKLITPAQLQEKCIELALKELYKC